MFYYQQIPKLFGRHDNIIFISFEVPVTTKPNMYNHYCGISFDLPINSSSPDATRVGSTAP